MKRIGFVQYINALPFTLPLRRSIVKIDGCFLLSTPKELNFLLKKKNLDCALTSAVTYLDENYSCLPQFGIAAHHEILSVNLYLKCLISQLTNKTIALTCESETSISLLKVLCAHFWKVKLKFVKYNPQASLTSYDGVLMIGDAALKQPHLYGFSTIDLATAWHEATGLPFVFALFVFRPEVETNVQEEFGKQMEAALKWSFSRTDYIYKVAQRQCPIGYATLLKYYSVCKYHLGQAEFKGLETFKHLRANV